MMTEELKQIFKSVLEIDEMDETISQKNCVKWDSLRHLNLMVEIETTFNIDLEPEEIAQMKNYELVVSVLKSKGIA